jgi:hypothetical protein
VRESQEDGLRAVGQRCAVPEIIDDGFSSSPGTEGRRDRPEAISLNQIPFGHSLGRAGQGRESHSLGRETTVCVLRKKKISVLKVERGKNIISNSQLCRSWHSSSLWKGHLKDKEH